MVERAPSVQTPNERGGPGPYLRRHWQGIVVLVAGILSFALLPARAGEVVMSVIGTAGNVWRLDAAADERVSKAEVESARLEAVAARTEAEDVRARMQEFERRLEVVEGIPKKGQPQSVRLAATPPPHVPDQ